MKDRKDKSRAPILAAGGIVLRNDLDLTPQFAVVQSRKLATWGLPKGKLAAGEDAMTAARREVLEETGHCVAVHEFLGTLVYDTGARTKVVQFWRMEAAGAPAGDLMRDVMAVDWLALADAVGRLSHMRERVFLEQVGPVALKLAGRTAEASRILVPGLPLAPAGDAFLSRGPVECALADHGSQRPLGLAFAARHTPDAAPACRSPQNRAVEMAGTAAAHTTEPHARKNLAERSRAVRRLIQWSPAGKALIRKTWRWFRHAMPHRHLPD
jgi:8-oxo-dGTP diphosphatase